MLKLALTLKQMQHRQDFLSLPKSENGDQDRTTFVKSFFDGCQETSLLVRSRIGLTERSVPACGLDNQNVHIAFRKVSAPHQGLVQEVYITRIEDFFPFRPKENAH